MKMKRKLAVLAAVMSAVLMIGGTNVIAESSNRIPPHSDSTLPERIKASIETNGDPTAAVRVENEDEYYIFELNDHVTREHVYYRTRYGIELAGDLYYAKDIDRTQKHPAIVVGPPFGGVKEQGPGVYGNALMTMSPRSPLTRSKASSMKI